MQPGNVIVLRLRPPRSGTVQTNTAALRIILKIIGRRFGWRCESVTEEQEKGAA